MELLNLLLSVALGLWCLYLRRRVDDTDESAARDAARLGELELTVWSLVTPTEPVRQTVVWGPETLTQSVEEPEPEREPVPPPVPLPIDEPQVPWTEPSFVAAGPTLRERLRTMFGDDEWETLVGGSILNKIGAVVLVIGIALFLAYSFAHVGAAGRTSLALLACGGMLAAGVWVERQAQYRVFARGLIGGGWAGLYASAYAMYAIPEARIIENPLVGSVGVLMVALGMIAHSLRYHSQAVTATAYFAAFAALAVTPSSPLAVISLIPLAASILYLAARFNWNRMALFGLAATYLTCITRASSGAPIAEVQSLFLVFWLLFNVFDLIRTRRGIVGDSTEFLYPANLAGFLGLSFVLWSRQAPGLLWLASASASLLFFADAIVRARLLRRSYEASVIVSALLAAFSITARAAGVWSVAALALEAEFLYLTGVWFDSAFLRGAGMAGFVGSLARAGWAWADGGNTVSPALLFQASIFYLNRLVRKQNVLMSLVAALLLAIVIGIEAPAPFVGTAWVILGAVLLQIGLRSGTFEFRAQGYALLAAGAANTAFQADWMALAISLAAVYLCAVETRRTRDTERRYSAIATSVGSALLAAILLWRVVPADYVGGAESGLAALVTPRSQRWAHWWSSESMPRTL